jgi:prepilin-type N-terminal cleavage/methylation domain-containing protein
MLKKVKKGFTLIELLVVIAIIGVLAGLVIVRIGNASINARDSKRKAAVDQIKTAIEQYKFAGGKCTPVTNVDLSATDVNGSGKAFTGLDSKYPSDYLSGSSYPTDPSSTSGTPIYYKVTIGDTSCSTYTVSTQAEGTTETISASG